MSGSYSIVIQTTSSNIVERFAIKVIEKYNKPRNFMEPKFSHPKNSLSGLLVGRDVSRKRVKGFLFRHFGYGLDGKGVQWSNIDYMRVRTGYTFGEFLYRRKNFLL